MVMTFQEGSIVHMNETWGCEVKATRTIWLRSCGSRTIRGSRIFAPCHWQPRT